MDQDHTDQPTLTPAWTDLDALIDFIDELRRDGYNVGVTEYLKVHQVLLAAAGLPADAPADPASPPASAQGLADPDQVRRLIGPILCSTPAEQHEFADRFAAWAARGRPAHTLSAAGHPSLAAELQEIARKDRLRWLPGLVAAVAILLVLSFLLLILFGPHGVLVPGPQATAPIAAPTAAPASAQPQPTPLFTAAPTVFATPPVAAQPRLQLPSVRLWPPSPLFWLVAGLGALLALIGVPLGRRIWYRHRAGLFLERRGAQEPPDITRLRVAGTGRGLFDTATMRTAIRRLRRRIPARARSIDIERTLAQSIRRGGWLSPVYASRQELPEYIVLVSRTSYPDHFGQLVNELLAVLRSGSVYFSLYYFDVTPELCASGAQRDRAVTLAELAATAAGQRLLVFGEAQVVLDPLSGAPAAWTSLLGAWPVHALFTPSPPGAWGAAEQQAARVMELWPALPEGLDLFIRTVQGEEGTDFLTDRVRAAAMPPELRARPIRWLEPDMPPPADVARVLTGVRSYLGEWGYLWLCACAVYPEVRWNLTLFLGAYLAGSSAAAEADSAVPDVPGSTHSPIFQRTLLDLVRLPWFRYGTIPDWLRQVLIAGLPRRQEADIRTALQGLLLSTLDDPQGGFQIEIAQVYQKTLRHLVKPILDLLRRTAPPHSPLNDRVFLAFMSGPVRTQLAVRLPEGLAAAWQRQGRVPQPLPAVPTAGSTPPDPRRAGASGAPAQGADAAPSAMRSLVTSSAAWQWALGILAFGLVPGAPASPQMRPVARIWETVRGLLVSPSAGLWALGILAYGLACFAIYVVLSALLLLPGGNINIAVADIGVLQADGTVYATSASGVLADAIAGTFDALVTDAAGALPPSAAPVTAWSDSTFDPQKWMVFGMVAGATDAERQAAAADIAARAGADAVIYGVYTPDAGTGGQIALDLYLSPASALAGSELAYTLDLLMAPTFVLPPGSSGSDTAARAELIAALRPQLAPVFLLLAGRQQSLAGNSAAANNLYLQAQAALGAVAPLAAGAGDGLWHLVGREAQRMQAWDAAIQALEQALAANPNNPFARLQLAQVYAERAYIGAAALAGESPSDESCVAPTGAQLGSNPAAVTQDVRLAEEWLRAADGAADSSRGWVGHDAVTQLLAARIALTEALLATAANDDAAGAAALAAADAAVTRALAAIPSSAPDTAARSALHLEAQFLGGRVRQQMARAADRAAAAAPGAAAQQQLAANAAAREDEARAFFARCAAEGNNTNDWWLFHQFVTCGCNLFAAGDAIPPAPGAGPTMAGGTESASDAINSVPIGAVTSTPAVSAGVTTTTGAVVSNVLSATATATSDRPAPVRLNFVDGVALVQGFARANQPQDFQFFGVAGETVLISLLDQPNGSAPPGGSFAVMGGANNVLYKSFAAPEMSWFFTLPVSQDYLITVLSSQDMVFTVEVAYPPAVAQQDTPSTANESPTEPSATEAATQSDGGGVLPACTNTTLLNGGFETDGFWILDGSSPAAQPVYVPDPVGSGRRALRLGLDPAAGAGGGDAVTLSSARQAIQIPADAAAVRLQWSHLDRTDEATSTAPGSDSERQEVLLLNGDGVTLAVLQSGRRNDSDWVTESVDLSPYIGQSLVLAFDVHNDGNGRATWQYLDDVTLFVCTAAPSQQTAP